jgi:ribulose-5-phosphate 4-epimerase/fuculose-1-phosphate aldolase
MRSPEGYQVGEYDDYRNEVLRCSQWLSEQGFFGSLTGTGGNVSLRILERDIIVITPSGKSYRDMSADDLCVLDFNLNPLEGDLPPSVEANLHLGIYQNRSDINAVVHTHQRFAGVFSVINEPIPPLFDEITLHIGDSIEIVPYAFSGTPELVKNVIGKLVNGCYCYILQNHGSLCLGSTLDNAALNAELLEKVAEIYYYALVTGREISTLPRSSLDILADFRKAKGIEPPLRDD